MIGSSLITGSAGYIGQRLSLRLAGAGTRVVGLGLPGHGDRAARFVPADVSVLGAWGDSFAGIDTVFHLAGKVHALSERRQDEAEYFRINTDGTRNVLEAARRHGVRRFVFFSTVKAMSRDDLGPGLGTAPMRAWDEADCVEPDTPYGQSKLAAEHLVLHGGYVPEPVVLRLCMVYGEAAKGNLHQMLKAVARRRFVPLPDVPNRRSMVHVEDALGAAELAALHPAAAGEIFIVSDGRSYSTREILALMHAALGREMPSWAVPIGVLRILGGAGDILGRVRGRRLIFDSDSLPKLLGSAWFSSAKIAGRLGFEPRWDLGRALPTMIDALRATERGEV